MKRCLRTAQANQRIRLTSSDFYHHLPIWHRRKPEGVITGFEHDICDIQTAINVFSGAQKKMDWRSTKRMKTDVKKSNMADVFPVRYVDFALAFQTLVVCRNMALQYIFGMASILQHMGIAFELLQISYS